jgi:hypothetical protein
VFAYAYACWLQLLADALDGARALDDPTWTVAVARGFVVRYTDAITRYDGGERPEPWSTVFDAVVYDQVTLLEGVIFSLSAHIVFDLPYVLQGLGTEPEHLRDYDRVNKVMSDSTDEVIDLVARRYYPLAFWLQSLPQRAEALLVLESARVSRGMAWYTAQRLADPNSAADAQRRAVDVPREIVQRMTQARLPAPPDRTRPPQSTWRSCMRMRLPVPMVRMHMTQQWLGMAMRPVRMVERWFRSWPEDYPSKVTVGPATPAT